MKKRNKILLITLLSLIGVVVLAIGTVCTIIFSPKILVPIVEKNLNKMEQFAFDIGDAELVFFKTFPRFSIHIEDVDVMVKPEGDTLASMDDLYASVDVMAFLRRKEVIVDRLTLVGGFANLSLLPSDTAPVEDIDAPVSVSTILESIFPLPFNGINLDKLSIEDFNLTYGGESFSFLAEEINAQLLVKSNADWLVDGDVEGSLSSLTFALGDTLMCDNVPVKFSLPFKASLQRDSVAVTLTKTHLDYAGIILSLSGDAILQNEGVGTDLELSLAEVKMDKLLPLVPAPFLHLIQDYNLEGTFSLGATVQGVLSESTLPLVKGQFLLENGGGELLSIFPYRVSDVNAKVLLDADLNREDGVNASISNLSAKFNRTNKIEVSGVVKDILGQMLCDLSLSAKLNLKDLLFAVPDSIDLVLRGLISLDANAKGRLEDFSSMSLNKTSVKAQATLWDLDAVYRDTLFVNASNLSLELQNYTSGSKIKGSVSEAVNEKFTPVYGGKLSVSGLDFTMGRGIYGTLTECDLNYGVSDVLNSSLPLSAFVDYSMGGLYGRISENELAVTCPKGTLALLPGDEYWCNYGSEELYLRSGSMVELDTDKILLGAKARRDTTANGLLAQWNPEINVDFTQGKLLWSGIEDMINIPAIKFDYQDDTLQIQDSRLQIGNSDFKLSGDVTDISKFTADEGLLRAKFDFISQRTDIDQLLDYFSGMGVEEESVEKTEAESDVEVEESSDGDPFMVPQKIDLTLNTDIASANALGNEIQNVGGEVTIQDGTLVVRQLGFTSDAARMQLTAMYKSPRRNHLYAGIDFHLLDIQIDKLIQMVPQIDSIVPMLKSFSGEAEFHLAAETYLNSKYELKKSTLLGAAAIEGKDLVVLDSETFDKIASLLNFQKSQENKIDSLVVDMTVFRNEVDIYPFVIGMDKYQLILSGRHNLDMSFNYHIDCISPIRLGLDIKGTFDDLKFGLTPTRYKNLFVPERRNDIQERTLKLMELINSSLKEKVVQE